MPKKTPVIIGETINNWTVISERKERGSSGSVYVLAKCVCGEIKEWAKIYKSDYKIFWNRLKSCEWNMDILNFRFYHQFLYLKEAV